MRWAARPGRAPRRTASGECSGAPAGSVNRNSAPPPSALARPRCVPPCASTRPRTMYRPRPVPPRLRPRQNRVKTSGPVAPRGCPRPRRTLTATASCRQPRPRSAVGHDLDGDSPPAVAHGVLQQVAEHLVDLVRVGPDLGQRPSAPVRRTARRRSPLATIRSTCLSAHGRRRSTGWRRTSSRPASIREMSSSSAISRVTRSASASTVSSISRFWSSVNRSHLAQQGGGEALDAGQRRAQLVGDGGQQLGLASLGPARGPRCRAGRRRRRTTGSPRPLRT